MPRDGGDALPKLLFDQNLASSLVARLLGWYPNSTHVGHVGLASAPDQAIWDFAAANGFIIVTKDDDFRQRSFVFGPPPQVVWIRLGNCNTREIEEMLRRRHDELCTFAADATAALLVMARRV